MQLMQQDHEALKRKLRQVVQAAPSTAEPPFHSSPLSQFYRMNSSTATSSAAASHSIPILWSSPTTKLPESLEPLPGP